MKNDLITETLKGKLREGGHVLIEGSGTSMSPVIRSGQKVRVTQCDSARLGIGDLVLYQISGGMVIHRVIRIIREPELRYLCRGDRCPNYDPLLDPRNIVGQVFLIGVVPLLRNHLKRLQVKLRERARACYRRVRPVPLP